MDYFDVVLIGLVGMGIMTNSIIFIAVKISTYRSQKMLKRPLATPLPVRRYFASEVLAHLVLAMVQAGIILAVGVLVFGGNVYGNILWLFLIVALATVCISEHRICHLRLGQHRRRGLRSGKRYSPAP